MSSFNSISNSSVKSRRRGSRFAADFNIESFGDVIMSSSGPEKPRSAPIIRRTRTSSMPERGTKPSVPLKPPVPPKSNVPNDLRRHPEFYFDDGSLVILVENVLFKVFRSTFTRCSSVFRDVFSLPSTANPSDQSEGSCDSNPFRLSGILKVDFERFLSILYPREFGQYSLKTANEWVSVLSLASRWDISSMRKLAISQIEALPATDLDSVDKILLSRQYEIDDAWSFAAYTKLCIRLHPLTAEEVTRLGIDTASKISQIREWSRALKGGIISGSHCQATDKSTTSSRPRFHQFRSASSDKSGDTGRENPSARIQCAFGNARIASWLASAFDLNPAHAGLGWTRNPSNTPEKYVILQVSPFSSDFTKASC